MGAGQRGRRFPLRAASAVVLLIALAVTAFASWGTRAVVHDQEHRLLVQRAREVEQVFTSAIGVIPQDLAAQGGILRATHGSRSAYVRTVAPLVAAGPGHLTFAWLRPQRSGQGYVVLAAVGDGLHTGEVVTDQRTVTFSHAMHSPQLMTTPVMGAGRTLGFAMGAPAAPAGTVLYRQSALGPVAAPRQAATAPFAELDVALYAAVTIQPGQLLVTTTRDVPLRGDVSDLRVPTGASTWLLSVKARRPLVGSVAAAAWWMVLLGGVLGALLLAAVIEAAGSRRDAALALYAGEHQIAETLQRSLLPRVPTLPGLEVAARYLAAGSGQEVGGDWFDAFPISGGRVGLAIGDVIGHDLAAASAMAQIRASLRAYAVDGDAPGSVINRLDHLVDALDLTQLVTVIYAVLEPPDPDGGRMLRYANAGHLPPLLRVPDGTVTALAGGSSIVIGAPVDDIDHVEAEHRLESGSTVLFFTDGLVEVPGRSLEDALDNLADTFAHYDDAMDVDTVCEQVLATAAARALRDDIALLVVRTVATDRSGSREDLTDAGHRHA